MIAEPSISDATASKASVRNLTRARRHKIQNYFVIWLDDFTVFQTDEFKDSLAQLCTVVGEVEIGSDPSECVDMLRELHKSKIFLIISETLVEHFISVIHDFQQLDAIYILCRNKVRDEQWIKQWLKIRGVFTSITSICESLKNVSRKFDQNDIPMSFIANEVIKAASHADKQCRD